MGGECGGEEVATGGEYIPMLRQRGLNKFPCPRRELGV